MRRGAALQYVEISSFKGLLWGGRPTLADLVRLLSTSLAGMASCTLSGSGGQLANFRDSIIALAASVHPHSTAAELESAVNYALELLRDHNERAARFNAMHTAELKAVLRTMTETITYLSESRTRSLNQLHFTERELEQASQIDDIRLVRARLITCLNFVREETERLNSESQARSGEVRQRIGQAPAVADPVTRFGSMDGVTGLPARRAAERAIVDALLQGHVYAVGAFVVNRLPAINMKYGRSIGDEVMLRVANYFAQHLSSSTFLYRWSGPALVAVTQVKGNPEDIRRAWAKISAAKQEINLESNQRSVFVLAETVMSFQVADNQISTEALFSNLDQFVTGHAEVQEQGNP